MATTKTDFEWFVWATRWLARGLSLVSIGTLAMFVAGDVPTPSRVTASEGVALTFFPLGVVIGMLLAWKWEGVGSGVGLASLALFYLVYGLVLSSTFPRGWWFLVFSLPLFLFLVAWAATALVRGGGAVPSR